MSGHVDIVTQRGDAIELPPTYEETKNMYGELPSFTSINLV